MGEALHVLVVVVVLVALGAPVAIGVALAGAMAATLFRRRRPDPLAVELDRVLEDILGRPSERAPMAQPLAGGLRESDGPRRHPV
ncbi:MAG TPA: hypothetical protein VKR78_04145 [Acidimicrobiales bacterium]|nr:hypothetical protein [Acidimicrobiales bacterium]